MKTAKIELELTDDEAWQYAQLLKRVDLATYAEWSEDKDVARTMMQAGEKFRAALAEVGLRAALEVSLHRINIL